MANTTDFFKQIGTSVSDAGKAGLEKTKEFRDSARITMEIRDRENSIHKAFRELGKAYYRDHRKDEDPEYEQVDFIRAAFEEIGELKASKDEVRGVRRCPKCGEVVQNGANFCPNCGEKYIDLETVPEGEAEEAEEELGEEVMEADEQSEE